MFSIFKQAKSSTSDDRASDGQVNANAEISKLTDTRSIAKTGILTLTIGFGSFLLWASFAQLDQGVPAIGSLSVENKRKVVQHHIGGIIKEVLIQEGDYVQADQALFHLDDSASKAQFENSRQRLIALSTAEARFLAEQYNKKDIEYSEALKIEFSDYPEFSKQINMQRDLMNTRRKSLQATISSLQENLKGQASVFNNSQKVELNLQNQISLMEKELEGVRQMVAAGYLPRVKQSEMERTLGILQNQLSEKNATLTQSQQAILEIKQKEIAIRSEYLKEVEQQLSQVRPELKAASEQYNAAKLDLQRTTIKSPSEGQVVGLAVQTKGAFIQAGQKLLEVVPRDESLIIEAKLQTHLVDRVHTKDKVDVRFSTFTNTPQLVVQGEILTLATDAINDSTTTVTGPYYLARVAITKEGIRSLGNRTLQAGMPVEVIFKSGQRTMLEYLLNPLLKRLSSSLKEE